MKNPATASAPPDSGIVEIVEVTYGKTVNIGSYESVRLDLTAKVPPGRSYSDILARLKKIMADEEAAIRSGR